MLHRPHRRPCLAPWLIEIGDDNVSALARQQQGDFAADSAGAADDQRDLAAELCLGGHALQLGFFERPILDAERLRSGKRHIVMELGELLRLLGVPGLRQRMGNLSIFQVRSRPP